jgi:phosphoribosylformylglycinamidine cyclo-ligase
MSATEGIQQRGDVGSELMFQACLSTIRASAGRYGGAAVLEHEGLRHVVVTELGPYRLLLNSDGVGTKMEVAERLGRFETIAWDLLAMLVDDAVRFGAQPLSMSNVLDCTRADASVVGQLAQGLARAAQAAGVAVVGGEIAELGARVGGRHEAGGYNWAGTLLSLVPRQRVLTGARLQAGQALVALREPGFRSNGYTLARGVLAQRHGDGWHEQLCAGTGRSWGAELLEPSRLYAPALLDALGRHDQQPAVEVTGIAHVTGGGIPGKLGRLLRGRGLGAVLEDLFAPPQAMLELQSLGALDDRRAYGTWCMGQGLLAATPDPDGLLRLLQGRGVEARLAGRLDGTGTIRIISRGALSPGHPLDYRLEAP